MSKHIKFRSLMSILYALIMLLPLSSVGFRCAYTIFNKNAYESYYGETINQSENVNMVNKNLEQDYTYEFYSNFNEVTGLNYVNLYLDVIQIDYVKDDNTTNTLKQNEDSIVSLLFFVSNNLQYMQFRDAEKVVGTNILIAQSTINFHYQYNGISTGATALLNYVKEVTYYKVYNKYSFLDNAFEYSLHEFVGNNGRGVLNLTDWFTSVFLQSSTHTQLYLDFINWYMNYTLLVSCVYLLYLVLMWFVSLARRLLTGMIEKGGNI